MSSGTRNPTLVLVISFVLAIACFLFSIGLAASMTYGIGRSAQEIVKNAAPSIIQLAAVRGTLRQLEVALSEQPMPDAADQGDGMSPEELVQRFEQELSAYFATPTFPGERELHPALRHEAAQVQLLTEQIASAKQRGDRTTARHLFITQARSHIEALDRVLVRCIEVNASNEDALAAQIVRRWYHAFSVGGAVTLGCVLLASITAFVAIQTIRRQTRLLALQADESVQFAGRVAHDILSPLMPIRLFHYLVETRHFEDPPLDRSRVASSNSLERIVQIVDGLLSFAKAGAHPAADAASDVRQVVQGAIEDLAPLAEERGVQVRVEELPGAFARCAPGVLSSLITNLVRNAIKFMGDSPERLVTVRVFQEPHTLRFEVADTGPGIPPEWHKKIFQPLSRASSSREGIGLGLATVKRLVESHGGSVWLASQVGQGSTFFFTLPQASSSDVPHDAKTPPHRTQAHGSEAHAGP